MNAPQTFPASDVASTELRVRLIASHILAGHYPRGEWHKVTDWLDAAEAIRDTEGTPQEPQAIADFVTMLAKENAYEAFKEWQYRASFTGHDRDDADFGDWFDARRAWEWHPLEGVSFWTPSPVGEAA